MSNVELRPLQSLIKDKFTSGNLPKICPLSGRQGWPGHPPEKTFSSTQPGELCARTRVFVQLRYYFISRKSFQPAIKFHTKWLLVQAVFNHPNEKRCRLVRIVISDGQT